MSNNALIAERNRTSSHSIRLGEKNVFLHYCDAREKSSKNVLLYWYDHFAGGARHMYPAEKVTQFLNIDCLKSFWGKFAIYIYYRTNELL